eukprot:5148919-Prymnesium_polylepis.1
MQASAACAAASASTADAATTSLCVRWRALGGSSCERAPDAPGRLRAGAERLRGASACVGWRRRYASGGAAACLGLRGFAGGATPCF